MSHASADGVHEAHMCPHTETRMNDILETGRTLCLYHELCMLIVSYHLNACVRICQFGLCVLRIHLGPLIHPCGMLMI